jgi:CelD/BcsL family acetyltransferase involved in cellulose biosynthesis
VGSPARPLDAPARQLGPAVEAAVLETPEELREVEAGWDRLAEQVARPFSAPAWLLAWWRNAARQDDLLRVVAVHDGGQLVGLAPFVVCPRRAGFAEYHTLGAGVAHRLAILSAPGREREVAERIAHALARARPRPTSVRVEAVDADAHWAAMMRSAWPGRLRPWLREDGRLSAPIVTLAGQTYEEWLKGKSKNFRDQLRRGRRNLEKRGATVRMAGTAEEAERAVRELVRLHLGRWDERGGSSALGYGIEAMLLDAARALVPSARMRIWSIELDGSAIASQLCLAAGGEVVYWNGGFDPKASDLKPGFLALAAAVEDGFARGERRFDLGGGAQPYKLRLADGDHPIAWRTLFPRGARYPLTRLQVAPRHTRERVRATAQRLDPETRRRIKRLLPGRS